MAVELFEDKPTPSAVTVRTKPKFSQNVLSAVAEAAETHNVDPELIKGIIYTESRGNPLAVSPKGAKGQMQLMPGTARDMGVKNSFDTRENILGGTKYFRQMLDRYNGDVDKAIAAYNAGPGTIDSGRMPDETRKYVSKVLGYAGRQAGTTEGGASDEMDIMSLPPAKSKQKIVKSKNALVNPEFKEKVLGEIAAPFETALSTVGATAGWLGGYGARGIELAKAKLEGASPEEQRRRGIAAQENIQNILSYEPKSPRAKRTVEEAGWLINKATEPFKEAAGLVKESWNSPLMDVAADFAADAGTFYFLGRAGKVAKGAVKEVPAWYYKMSVKERGVVKAMNNELRSGRSTGEQVRQAMRDTANDPVARAELIKKWNRSGDTAQGEGVVEAKAPEVTPKELPNKATATPYEPFAPEAKMAEGQMKGEGFVLNPEKPVPPTEQRPGFPSEAELTAQREFELAKLDKEIGEIAVQAVSQQSPGKPILRKHGGETPEQGPILVEGEKTGPRILNAPEGLFGEKLEYPMLQDSGRGEGFVMLEGEVKPSGKIFKTEADAETAALKAGIPAEEFEIVGVGNGFGYQRLRINRAGEVKGNVEEGKGLQGEEGVRKESEGSTTEVGKEEGKEVVEDTKSVEKVKPVEEPKPSEPVPSEKSQILTKKSEKKVLSQKEIDQMARDEVIRLRNKRTKVQNTEIEKLAQEGKAIIEEAVLREPPTAAELAERERVIKETESDIIEAENLAKNAEISQKIIDEKIPQEMSYEDWLRDIEKLPEVNKTIARIKAIETDLRNFRMGKLNLGKKKEIGEKQFDLSTRKGLEEYRKAKKFGEKKKDVFEDKEKEVGDWEKALNEEGLGELNFGDEVGRAYMLEDFSRVVAKGLHDVGVAVWNAGKRTFFEWKKAIVEKLGRESWEKYKSGFVKIWDLMKKYAKDETGAIKFGSKEKGPESKVIRDLKKQADEMLGAVSTRLKNIDPTVMYRMRKFEFNVGTKVNKLAELVKPFVDATKKMSNEDYNAFDIARKSGDVQTLKTLVNKYKLGKEYHDLRVVLEGLYQEAKDLGMDARRVPNYHPRRVKDPEGFLNYLYDTDTWSAIDYAIKQKEKALPEGQSLTLDERAQIANSMLRGYKSGEISLSRPSQMHARTVKDFTKEIDKFYESANESLFRYISDMTNAIEARKLFGKGMKSGDINLRETIGYYTMQLSQEGKLTPTQERTLKNILEARFNPIGPSEFWATAKNIGYIDTLGSFSSAVTQIGDMAWSAYKNGVYTTAKAAGQAITRKTKIRRADLGIERIAAEFSDASKVSKWADSVFKWTGLTAIDAFGKETLVNGALLKAQKLAKKATQVKDANGNVVRSPEFTKLYDELKPVFGKETVSVIKDLKSGVLSDNVKLYLFNVLSDFQPVSLLEMPQKYLTGGNGRVFYMLKTFTLKQFDVYRREIFKQIGNSGTRVQGLKNMVRLGTYLAMANATADVIQDLMSGRPVKLNDLVVDNIWKLAGGSRYMSNKMAQKGPARTLLEQALPPTKGIDAAWTDLKKVIKEGGEFKSEFAQSIPIFGKPYYWWVGKGKERSEKERGSIESDDVMILE